MKIVILAGGFGTRLSEETVLRPKPMVEIGEMPILWHIMKIYSHYDFNDFIICVGYKGYCIKEYFAQYFLHQSDVTFDFQNENKMETHNHTAEPWRVTLVNTGHNTYTGGRVKAIKKYVEDETFMLTYGDGVGNVNIPKLLEFHKINGKVMTLTSTQPAGRFGALTLNENDEVVSFLEKPCDSQNWINAGFFVCEPEVFNYIEGPNTILEREPMETLAMKNQLMAFKHRGFWMPMDTLRDKKLLEELWNEGRAPWKLWE